VYILKDARNIAYNRFECFMITKLPDSLLFRAFVTILLPTAKAMIQTGVA
jgi:hypothetical protein